MTAAEESTASNTPVRNAQAVGWLLAFVANVVVGAWFLQRTAPPVPPPIIAFILYLTAALILFITQHRYPAQRHATTEIAEARATTATSSQQPGTVAEIVDLPRWRLGLFALALALMGYALLRLPRLEPLDNYAVPFASWMLSILSYTLALAPPDGRFIFRWIDRLVQIWQRNRIPLLILLNILLFALLLRVTYLEYIPYILGGDEASQGLEAVRVLQGDLRNPFTTGWLGVPTLSFFLNSVTVDLLGMTKTGLRLPWALVGVATVAATFLLVRRLQGLTLALATTALLATYHYHIHFSRLGSNQIADPLFVTSSLVFLYYALDRRRTAAWILTGVTAGLAFYFYAGARFTPVVIVAVLAFALLRQPGNLLRVHGRGILAMLGAFLLVAAPMLQYALRFPDDFNARLNQVGIIQSGWLQRELAAGNELWPTLWQQVERAVLAFNYYPDRTVWYGLEQPLLNPLFGALFAVGLLYATLRVISSQDRRLAPFVFWWWGGILAGGILTESPPSSQRLTTLTVPTCFFIAFVLWHALGLAREAITNLPRRLLLAAGVVAFAIYSLNLYFLEYTPKYRYGGRHAELATSLEPVFEELSPAYDAYFVGAPWMYWGFATIPYLSPTMPGRDLEEPIEGRVASGLLRPGRGAVFIVRPERIAELPYIQETFPQGELQEVHSRAPGSELLAVLYVVPPESEP